MQQSSRIISYEHNKLRDLRRETRGGLEHASDQPSEARGMAEPARAQPQRLRWRWNWSKGRGRGKKEATTCLDGINGARKGRRKGRRRCRLSRLPAAWLRVRRGVLFDGGRAAGVRVSFSSWGLRKKHVGEHRNKRPWRAGPVGPVSFWSFDYFFSNGSGK